MDVRESSKILFQNDAHVKAFGTAQLEPYLSVDELSDQNKLARREHLQNSLQVRTFYDDCAFVDKTFQALGLGVVSFCSLESQ